MRVLIVSQYFRPEPGATQNRLGTFADGLAARGHEVLVVCEQPNHPAGRFHAGYGRRPVVSAQEGGVRVHRLLVATSPRKTTVRRLAFYGTFALGAAAAVAASPRPDVLFATSPPLPGALAAAGAARGRRIPYVLDVRDIWPAAAEALGELSNPRVVRAFERGERWAYRSAARVTATTAPFCDHVDRLAGAAVSVHLPNGALDALVERPVEEPPADGPFVVGYAGNMGIAQGLPIVLDAAERLRDEDVHFLMLGDGPLAEDLRSEAARRALDRVRFEPAVPVEEVPRVVRGCHALLVPLRDHSLLDLFVPSKLYDALALGRPALVAARGEAAAVVHDEECGVAVPPEDGEALAAAVRELAADRARARALGEAGRRVAARNTRSRQVERLERVLLEATAG